MKKSLILSLSASFLLFGCNKNELNCYEQELEKQSFTATIEENTKTSLDTDGNVLWKQGDQVSVFNKNSINCKYQVSKESDGKSTAKLIWVSGSGSGVAIDNKVAYYPYHSTVSITENPNDYTLSGITLPDKQTYVEGSFGNGDFPMVATSSTPGANLYFKNILGCLRLQLKGTASIASIKITGNNGEILCGTATVIASLDNTPLINLTDVSAKTVVLDCGVGAQLNSETATSFVIALPPMNMEGGFTVIAVDTDGGEMEIKTTKSQTISRSSILNMPVKIYTPDEIHTAVDLGLPSGTLWATMNVGASKPSDYGDYFAWAETSPKEQYLWTNLKYRISGDSYENVKFSKYVVSSDYGEVDNKTILEPMDDVASEKWKGNWRIPTADEWRELHYQCSWKWETVDGCKGYIVTSNKPGNSNSIFLPAAGSYSEYTIPIGVGNTGCYFSSSLHTDFSSCHAFGCYFRYGEIEKGGFFRSNGLSIRPVCTPDKN